MKENMHLFVRVLFVLFSIAPNFVLAREKDQDFSRETQKEVQKLIAKHRMAESGLGMLVVDPRQNGVTVFQLNSKKAMTPASITKVLTTAMILKEFQPGTRIVTELWSDASIEKGSLKGDLYFVGAGDPSFVSENMWVLVNNFKRSGITRIEGDIVVDDSLFDSERVDSSRQEGRVDRAYDAPIGAMSFNWNSVNVYVRPSEPGQPAFVFADPQNDFIEVINKTKTVDKGESGISVEREAAGKGKDLLIVSGKINKNADEITVYKNITEPNIWSGTNLKAFLLQRGIEVAGKVRSGMVSDKAIKLAKSESKPIEHMLADMNKFSNNFVAEMLTKASAAKSKKGASLKEGIQKIEAYLLSLGLKATEFKIVNPSGLSNENRISAEGMVKVLTDLQDRFSVQPEFFSSLPIAGIDGTLKNRMKSSSATRWVRAKTGHLSNVTTLAGYIGREDGSVLPFAFLYNGGKDSGEVRRFFDEVCELLVESK